MYTKTSMDVEKWGSDVTEIQAETLNRLAHERGAEVVFAEWINGDFDVDENGNILLQYHLAFTTSGEGWDIVESFFAADDAAANQWAEEHEGEMEEKYNNTEWYVIDNNRNNING